MKSVEQMINERAYAIYEERTRKGLPGNSDSDYYQAAKEITALVEKKNAAKAKTVGAAKKVAAPKKSAPAPVAKAVVKTEPKATAPAKKKVVKKKSSR